MHKIALLMTGGEPAGLDLAGALFKNGWGILASSGTAKAFRENGIIAVDVYENVEDREAEAFKLVAAIRGKEWALKDLRIPGIDLVAVNLREPEAEQDWVRGDLGGCALVHAAILARKIVAADPMVIASLAMGLWGDNLEDKKILSALASSAALALAEYHNKLHKVF